jgi:hypothetical protein
LSWACKMIGAAAPAATKDRRVVAMRTPPYA